MANSISLTPAQATHLSSNTRNDIYSLLLSGSGIPTIERTLSHELQSSGWLDSLKSYITSLLRSGEVTTLDEIMERVRAKMELEKTSGTNGVNGVVNGVNGNGVHEGIGEDVDLKIPERAIREGAKAVRQELEKVCDITTGEGS